MPALWVSFGEALAAVAGALMGLLFVAVSVKSEVLAASRSLSSRAAQTLVLFGISVFIAIFLVDPQPHTALGSELLAVSAVSGAALLRFWTAELVAVPIKASSATSKGSPPKRPRPCSLALRDSPSFSRPVVACIGSSPPPGRVSSAASKMRGCRQGD